MSEGNHDLSLVTREELIDEMKRRTSSMLLVFTQDPKVHGDPLGDYSVIDYHGGMVMCLGLAEFARATLTKDLVDGQGRSDGDDENDGRRP